MVSLLEALSNAARNAYCASAGPVSVGLGVLGDVYAGLGGQDQGDDLRAAGQLYRNGQQLACGRQPDSVDEVLVPPFTGGQCDGIRYRVTQDRVSPPEGGVGCFPPFTGAQFIVFGPISQERVPLDSRVTAINVIARRSAQGPLEVIGQLSGAFNLADCPMQDLVITDIERLDGGADDCGDPGIVPPQYNPDDWTHTPMVEYDGPDGSPITINPRLVFGPGRLGPDGGLNHPVEVTFETGITANLNFDLSIGELNVFGGPGSPSGDFNGPSESDEDQDENLTDGDIIGVRVIATQLQTGSINNTIEQTNGNPDILIPNIGFVAFRYQTSTQSDAWGTDIPVKNDNFVAFADRPALEVRGTPQDGWDFVVIPIREKREGCCC